MEINECRNSYDIKVKSRGESDDSHDIANEFTPKYII